MFAQVLASLNWRAIVDYFTFDASRPLQADMIVRYVIQLLLLCGSGERLADAKPSETEAAKYEGQHAATMCFGYFVLCGVRVVFRPSQPTVCFRFHRTRSLSISASQRSGCIPCTVESNSNWFAPKSCLVGGIILGVMLGGTIGPEWSLNTAKWP